MVKVYRGTNFRIFAQNFEGSIFENNANNLNNLHVTPTVELALKRYADSSVGDKDPYLALLLVFDIPEEDIYTILNTDVEDKYGERLNDPEELQKKAKNGKQVVFRKQDWQDKWQAFFLKTKCLESIYEVSSTYKTIKEFKQESNRVDIQGDKEKIKEYIKKRKP